MDKPKRICREVKIESGFSCFKGIHFYTRVIDINTKDVVYTCTHLDTAKDKCKRMSWIER